ncbi:MAG: SDR family NAD(P)-dependent oxidoreductase [Planctomycetia bacterium]|nr:SDR family NAD(P)-dependent oxidoreductase [Planctomycetia bacterium]
MSGKNAPVAFITGASSGLGKSFARLLASEGVNLILVARRSFVLESLKEELEKQFNVSVETLAADLSTIEGIQKAEKKIESCENLTYLINNAGFGVPGVFPDVNVEMETRMILLHNLAPMRLCRAALIPMAINQHGFIINVASAAGFMAARGSVDYNATKAFLITFSRALQCDCVDKRVRVQALCPGFVRTGFHDSETMRSSGLKEKIPGWMWLDADWVVKKSLAALRSNFCRRVAYVPSCRYRWMVWFASSRFLAPLRILFTRGKSR